MSNDTNLIGDTKERVALDLYKNLKPEFSAESGGNPSSEQYLKFYQMCLAATKGFKNLKNYDE